MRAAVIISIVLAFAADARAEKQCNCVAVAGDVAAAIQAEVARADGLYARGDYAGALALYVKAHAASPRDSALIYAQAMAKWQMGVTADAKAMFEKYLAAGGQLAYADRARANLSDLGAKVTAPVGAAVGATGGALGMVGGVAGGAVDTTVGLTDKRPKPKKIARGASIALGVIAIAAIGAVAIHAIAAGVKDDVELDAKFDLGLGAAGVSTGIAAIYVGGLTTATAGVGAASGGVRCADLPAGRPVVAPMVTHGGAGLTGVMTF